MVNVWTNTVSIPWSEVGQGIGGLHLWPQAQQWRLERLAWTYVGMLLGIYLRVYWFIPNIQTFICMDELLNEKNATRFSHLIFGLFEFDLLQFPEKKSISSHYSRASHCNISFPESTTCLRPSSCQGQNEVRQHPDVDADSKAHGSR
jgi:hypothetical protein